MNKTMTATQARKQFYDVIKSARRPGRSIRITHRGLPEVVIMSAEEFEGWLETMDILAHPQEAAEAMYRLKNKEKEKTVTLAELKKSLKLT